MIVYIVLIFGILLIGLALKPGISTHRRKTFLWLAFLFMFIISSFRGITVGTDTKTYVYIFDNLQFYSSESSRYEAGFLAFLNIIHGISDNPTLFLAISSAICIGITCIFIYKFSDDPVLSVMLYILLKPFFFQMTGIRQSLSTAFVMFGFSAVMNKRTIERVLVSVLFMLFAIQFHSMAVVAFILLIMWLCPISRSELVTPSGVVKWTIVISIGAFALYTYIMKLVAMIFPQYVRYFNSVWGDSNYVASLFKMLIQLVFLVMGAIYLKNQKLTDMDRFGLIMTSISVIIGTLSMRMEIWGRLSGMVSIYTAVLFVPSFSSKVTNVENRMTLKSLIFVFSFAYMLVTFIFRPEWDGVVPYTLFR